MKRKDLEEKLVQIERKIEVEQDIEIYKSRIRELESQNKSIKRKYRRLENKFDKSQNISDNYPNIDIKKHSKNLPTYILSGLSIAGLATAGYYNNAVAVTEIGLLTGATLYGAVGGIWSNFVSETNDHNMIKLGLMTGGVLGAIGSATIYGGLAMHYGTTTPINDSIDIIKYGVIGGAAGLPVIAAIVFGSLSQK